MELCLILLVLLPLGATVGCLPRPAAGMGLARWGIACSLLQFLLGLGLCVAGGGTALVLPGLCGDGLGLVAGGFRLLVVQLVNLLFLVCAIWAAAGRGNKIYWAAGFAAQSGVLGVFLAADLFTLLIFFELMSLVSALWVYGPNGPASRRAGDLYLAVGVLGGLFLLAGTMLLANQVGDLTWSGLAGWQGDAWEKYPAGLCLFVGFGAKAGAFPLHIWMPSAYEAASPPAAALLSGVLSKAGWLGLLLLNTVILPGDLAWGVGTLALGSITLLLGGMRATLSSGLHETLAYSSMAQTGFLLLGAALAGLPGPQQGLAWCGVVLYLVNHAVVKTVLFLLAGQARVEGGSSHLKSLRGVFQNSPWRTAAFLAGGATLCGLPLTSGYLAKTLLHESLTAAGELLPHGLFFLCEGAFLLGGGCTAAYLLKLWASLFRGGKGDRPGRNGKTLVCQYSLLVLGFTPLLLGTALPLTQGLLVLGAGAAAQAALAVHYFSWHALQGIVGSTALGAALYGLLVWDQRGRSLLRLPDWLSLEKGLYRPLLTRWLPKAGAAVAWALGSWPDGLLKWVSARFFDGSWDREAPRDRTWAALLDRGEGRSFRQSFVWTWLLFLCGVCLVVALIYLAAL